MRVTNQLVAGTNVCLNKNRTEKLSNINKLRLQNRKKFFSKKHMLTVLTERSRRTQ